MADKTYALVSYPWRAYDVTVLSYNTPKDIERAKRAIKKSIAVGYRVKVSELEFHADSYRVDVLQVAPAVAPIIPEWI